MLNKSRKAASSRRGFTLIEIMIVVLIIGILLAIAVPNFVKARESSRAKSCIANLKQIDAAKEQYAMDEKVASGATAAWTNLSPAYLKTEPKCPATNAAYVPGTVGGPTVCPNPGSGATAHVLP